MVKTQIRVIGALAILLMLGASPLSVTYSFAENGDNQELRGILTEKIVDGKLVVHHYALPEEFSEADLKRILSFDGETSWGFINYKEYQSGIILFDGKASKNSENLWEISIEKDVLDGNLICKIVFSGKIIETNEENVFTVSFVNSMIKNLETAQNIRLLQIGESATDLEKSICSNQEFENSIFR